MCPTIAPSGVKKPYTQAIAEFPRLMKALLHVMPASFTSCPWSHSLNKRRTMDSFVEYLHDDGDIPQEIGWKQVIFVLISVIGYRVAHDRGRAQVESAGQELCACGPLFDSDRRGQARLSKTTFEPSPARMNGTQRVKALPVHSFPPAEAEHVHALQLVHLHTPQPRNVAPRTTDKIDECRTVASFWGSFLHHGASCGPKYQVGHPVKRGFRDKCQPP